MAAPWPSPGGSARTQASEVIEVPLRKEFTVDPVVLLVLVVLVVL